MFLLQLFLWVFQIQSLAISVANMGPFYIKIAQIVTTRPDLFPAWLVRSLRPLQDQVKPEFIQDVDGQLLASGSIAQVYLVGNEQILKHKRPNIDQRIKHDLGYLRYLT